jgi:hypothetical protein
MSLWTLIKEIGAGLLAAVLLVWIIGGICGFWIMIPFSDDFPMWLRIFVAVVYWVPAALYSFMYVHEKKQKLDHGNR